MNRIKFLRLEKDMSQRELSEKIGCSQKSIDYWEKGEADPTAKFICSLADCFACSADYLLGRSDDFGNVSIVGEPDKEEKAVLRIFRELSKEDRAFATEFLEFLRNRGRGDR